VVVETSWEGLGAVITHGESRALADRSSINRLMRRAGVVGLPRRDRPAARSAADAAQETRLRRLAIKYI
jgi:hypothetical protein